MKILVVDDDNISLLKMETLLSKYGSVESANSGIRALEMIKKAYGESDPYNLCTMDIEMPEIDGQETVELIRDWEKSVNISSNDHIKIIMATIKKGDENIMTSFYKGCEWYMKKPVTPEKIKNALLELKLIQK